MKFEIFILPQAERDLVDTLDWLRAKSIKGATNWLNVWEQAFNGSRKLAIVVETPLKIKTR